MPESGNGKQEFIDQTHRKMLALVMYLVEGNSISDACRLTGNSRSSFYYWRRTSEWFRKVLRESLADMRLESEQLLRIRIMNGTLTDAAAVAIRGQEMKWAAHEQNVEHQTAERKSDSGHRTFDSSGEEVAERAAPAATEKIFDLMSYDQLKKLRENRDASEAESEEAR